MFKIQRLEKLQNNAGIEFPKDADGNIIASPPATFKITDKDQYIKSVAKIYRQSKSTQLLNSKTKNLIENHIPDDSKEFSTQAGLPGLHAEVQVLMICLIIWTRIIFQ